jgi:hypothetical protein
LADGSQPGTGQQPARKCTDAPRQAQASKQSLQIKPPFKTCKHCKIRFTRKGLQSKPAHKKKRFMQKKVEFVVGAKK